MRASRVAARKSAGRCGPHTDRASAQSALAWLKQEQEQVDPKGRLRLAELSDRYSATIPTSGTKNDRAKVAHHSSDKVALANRQAYSGREDSTVACRSVAVPVSFWFSLTQSLNLLHQGNLRARVTRSNIRHFPRSTPTLRKAPEADSCHTEL
jgi:hypothetical protein